MPLSNISDVTIGQWLDAKVIPTKPSINEFVGAFGLDFIEAFQEAGYEVYMMHTSLRDILVAVLKADISPEEKTRLKEALDIVEFGDLRYKDPTLMELIEKIYDQDVPMLTKAERIAALVGV